MNARSVPICAALRLGMILTAILLVSCLRPANGSEVTITVKGTVNGGRDSFGIFGMGGTIPSGTPYTIVFTFDDTKGHPMTRSCPASGSGIIGTGVNSATAVMTINGKSYEFGRKPDSRSRTWRHTSTMCSQSEIGIAIQEGPESLVSGVNIKIRPNQGQRSLTQDGDWRGSVSLSNFDARNGDNAFSIRRPWDYGNETMRVIILDVPTRIS